jgi:16S rRNA (uracil1498-N3)-methyltransferase
MQLFYAPELQGDRYFLDQQESKHCIKVLRMQTGDTILLTDGAGGLYTAKLENEDPRRCEVSIIKSQKGYGKRDYHLHIAIAPTKNIGRLEWFLEKATEIGIDEITPLICQRSERKVVKPDRLVKVITSALKQSLKAYHPVLNKQTSFESFLNDKHEGDKYMAYVEEGDHPALQSLYEPERNVTILIGPEGDFSPEEVVQARKNGYKTVSLGKSRLRTETAGIVACHTIALLNEH